MLEIRPKPLKLVFKSTNLKTPPPINQTSHKKSAKEKVNQPVKHTSKQARKYAKFSNQLLCYYLSYGQGTKGKNSSTLVTLPWFEYSYDYNGYD